MSDIELNWFENEKPVLMTSLPEIRHNIQTEFVWLVIHETFRTTGRVYSVEALAVMGLYLLLLG
jgi:hypothetical protein